MLDNIDIAILTKVNELADRHGFKPYEFVATIQHERESGHMVLSYEVPVSGAKQSRFFSMLDQLGAGQETGQLLGTSARIIDALDSALRLAPRQRR